MHNNSDQLIFAPLNQSTRKMFNFYLYALIDKSKTNKNIKHIYFLFQSPSIIQSKPIFRMRNTFFNSNYRDTYKKLCLILLKIIHN